MPSDAEPVIRLDRLTKRYGEVVGIQNLTLDVAQGEVFGLLGPNGAGKTTTIRILLDFIRPTAGAVSVFGMNPRRDGIAIRRRTGYLPGDFITYNYMSGANVTEYFTRLRSADPTLLHPLCERFGLDLTRRIGDLSKGNRQKIGLVQAFMNDPDLLILDEPTSGLDPLLQHEFQELLREEKERGKTIFLSSHVMSEVEAVCERVCIIREGELVKLGSIDELIELNRWAVTISFAEAVSDSLFDHLDGVNVNAAQNGRFELSAGGDGAIDAVVKTASRHRIASFESEHANLEDTFLEFYAAETEAAG